MNSKQHTGSGKFCSELGVALAFGSGCHSKGSLGSSCNGKTGPGLKVLADKDGSGSSFEKEPNPQRCQKFRACSSLGITSPVSFAMAWYHARLTRSFRSASPSPALT